MSSARLSVVMPVRNAEPYLGAAIRSILDQTFQNFEYVIFDDGSTDSTSRIVQDWAKRDTRIRYFKSDRQLGLAASSNAAVEHASSHLIARMDGDDISHPSRLERQIVLLDDPSIVLVGSLAEGIDASGKVVRGRDSARLFRASRFTPFPHGSSMFRRSDFGAIGGYREICDGWEDTDFFFRLSRRGRALVTTDVLYQYRYHQTNSSITFGASRRLEVLAREARCSARLMATGSYEDALKEPIPTEVGASFSIHAYAGKSALAVWTGERPRTRLTLAHRPAKGWQRALARSILYLTWGKASPRSLRKAQNALVGFRDRWCMRKVGDTKEVEWRIAL